MASLAVGFADAVAEGRFELAEDWAEALFRIAERAQVREPDEEGS
jgi:hypothetical protein